MTQEEAVEIARQYVGKHTNVAVQSDGFVFLDTDLAKCLENAKSNDRELFIIKGELPKKQK